MRVDLNADIGEGSPYDEELMEIVTSVNVGCGAHAGSPEHSRVTARLAVERGLKVAAHPGYPDRQSFGRGPCHLPPGEWLPEQLSLFPHDAVKPHGAFYHDLRAGRWPDLRFDVPVIGVPDRGPRHLREAFADRRLGANGALMPRCEAGALIRDPGEAAANALSLARTGAFDTICVHGDTPEAIATALAVRRALEAAGVRVEPWS